jgi:hypothetical protein
MPPDRVISKYHPDTIGFFIRYADDTDAAILKSFTSGYRKIIIGYYNCIQAHRSQQKSGALLKYSV